MSLHRVLLCFLFLALPVQAQDILVLGIFTDRAVLEVDGERVVIRVGERGPQGVELRAADSRNGHVTVHTPQRGERRLDLGGRAGGGYRARESATAQIYRNASGAFSSPGSINGHGVSFLIDTGATAVVLSANEARRMNIEYARGTPAQVMTASGVEFAYRIALDRVRVGSIEQRNVEGLVLLGSEPRIALLGMSFLNRVDMRNEGQALILEQRF